MNNTEMSRNLTAVGETTEASHRVREKYCQGKLITATFTISRMEMHQCLLLRAALYRQRKLKILLLTESP